MRTLCLAILSTVSACAPHPGSAPSASPRATLAIPLDEARERFAEAGALCAADHDLTWGRSLCGPIMLVDPTTRLVVANQADAEGRLEPRGGVFVGALPAGANAANTSTVWGGVRWAQILWPLPPDRDRRAVLMMHESFHRLAPQLPIAQPPDGDNAHLDTLDGRTYLQLEWRALAAALRATTDADRHRATSDALAFRLARRAAFPAAAAAEDALELQEGLAEYTGVVVGLRDPAARIDAALRDLADAAQADTFVRSFAYATGPALGLLLAREAPQWRTRLAHVPSLTQLAVAICAPPSADVERAAARYGGAALRGAEQARAAEREATIRRYRQRLVDGPVATLRFVRMHIAFDPRTVRPIGPPGSVYPTLRVVDDWGILEVTRGALVKADWSAVVVPAPATPTASTIAGDGWTLTLAQGWRLEPDERAGDLRLTRAPS